MCCHSCGTAWGMQSMVAVILLACACGSGCLRLDRQPAQVVNTQAVCEDSGRAPDAWLVELVAQESDLRGPFLEGPGDVEPVRWHMILYELHELGPENSILRVPPITLGSGAVFGPLMGLGRVTETRSWCYAQGYERAFPSSVADDGHLGSDDPRRDASGSRDASEDIPVVRYKMVPWDVSTPEFRAFWVDFVDDERFAERVSQWKRLVCDDQDTLCRLLEWYLGRYTAAVESGVDLEQGDVAMRHVTVVRGLLERVKK